MNPDVVNIFFCDLLLWLEKVKYIKAKELG